MNRDTLDIVIATQVNDGLKHCVTSCAKSATEASTPALREAFAQISQDGIQRQARLAKIMESRGWYVPLPAHHEDIQKLIPQLRVMEQSPGMATGAAPVGGGVAGMVRPQV